MNANAQKGVWEETLINGHTMVVDTNLNIIRVINTKGDAVKCEIEEGIRICDIEAIKKSYFGLRG